MANKSKERRDKLIGICQKLREGKSVDQVEITQLEQFIREFKYGLVFEEHEEAVDEMLKTHIPVFKERKDLEIRENLNSTDCNFLLEGDNLHSLKLLQKTHRKIDVIYIDPPYNTGSQDFKYNDRFVNEDDGFRHSKWLSFMKQRLLVARDILASHGVIFISIDEHEFAQIKLLCDSVFGESNYVENFIWVKNSTKNLSKTTSTKHEYVLCYAKDIAHIQKDQRIFRIKKRGLEEVKEILKKATEDGLTPKEAEKQLKAFYKAHPELKGISSYDKVDYGPLGADMVQKCLKAYTLDNTSAPKATGKAETYTLIHPIDGLPCITPTRGWAYTWETMQEHIKNGLIEFYDDHNHVPRYKRYLDTVETEVMRSVIEDFKDGKKELNAIFGESPFENPKPTTLIKSLLSGFPDDITVLDFFAGSGTTGQAVLELNQDGGDRKFILCTNNEIQNKARNEFLVNTGLIESNTAKKGSKAHKAWLEKIDALIEAECCEELFLSDEYQKLGICRGITYERLRTVITGVKNDGTKYSDGIPANLKYLKAEMIDKNDADLEDLLHETAIVLKQLENMSFANVTERKSN